MTNLIVYRTLNGRPKKYFDNLYSGKITEEVKQIIKNGNKYEDLMKLSKKYENIAFVNIFPVLKILQKKNDLDFKIINEYIAVGNNGKVDLYYLYEGKFKKINRKKDKIFLVKYSTGYNFGKQFLLKKLGYNIHFIFKKEMNLASCEAKLESFLLQETEYKNNVLEGIFLPASINSSNKQISNYLLEKIIDDNFIVKQGFTNIVVKIGNTSLGSGILFFNLKKQEDLDKFNKFLLNTNNTDHKGNYLIAKKVDQSDYELRCYINTLNNKIKINGYLLKKKRPELQTHHSGGVKNYRNFDTLEQVKNIILKETNGKISLKFDESYLLDFFQYLKDNNFLTDGGADIAILNNGNFILYENNIIFMAMVDKNGIKNIEQFYDDFYTNLV